MAKPWEKYQQQSQPAATTEKFDPSTAGYVDPFAQPDSPVQNQTDYLGGVECIAILWIPFALAVWYFKKQKAPPSGWRRIGVVLSSLILLIGTFVILPYAFQGDRSVLAAPILFLVLASLPWVFGYAIKWIMEGFASKGRNE